MHFLRLTLASALLVGLFSAPASLQQAQKGGEDETGPYDVVPNSEGNLYAADSFGGRTQKFRPRADADPAKLVGRPVALMPKSTQ